VEVDHSHPIVKCVDLNTIDMMRLRMKQSTFCFLIPAGNLHVILKSESQPYDMQLLDSHQGMACPSFRMPL
jgi:hypothetical protein